jgi:alpha-glucosidase
MLTNNNAKVEPRWHAWLFRHDNLLRWEAPRLVRAVLIILALSPLMFSVSLANETTATAVDSTQFEVKESASDMAQRPAEVWSILEDGRRITLEVASSHILRLRVQQPQEKPRNVSYAVIRRSWPRTQYRLSQEANHVRLETAELAVELKSQPFGMVVRDSSGRTLFETTPRGLKAEGESTVLSRRSVAGEISVGMGEVGETFDRSGGKYVLWNIDDFSRNPRQNFYCQIPFVIHVNPRSGDAFGLFIDNPGKQIWDLGKTRPSIFSYQTVTGDFDLWLIFGKEIPSVLRDWVDLTGHMERPPLWALGYHQCRWSYYPESRVREIAAEFRRRRIPCDAIYLDIDYMDGYRVFTWHPQRFPAPEKLIADLREQGFKTVVIVDPGVKIDPNYEVYKDFLSRPGFFCVDPQTSEPFVGTVWPGKTHFPDFTRPDVRERWGEYQKRALLDKGVAGIWNDMNEPHIFEAKEFPGHVLQYDFGRTSPHSRVHQVYGLMMAAASHDGWVKARPHVRPFIITRSGWAGVQRYALMWTGDNQSTWASMALDLQLNLSMGLSGVAFVGCDIGGFAHDCYPELYARWIEWGVFQPFCRTHSAAGTTAQEPWSFGPTVERIARQMIEFRMRLLPYLYTTFVEAAESGVPVNRPLLLAHPADTNCQRIADEFYLGDALLVAPVIEPAKDRRMVYLPAGTWYHWWTNKRYDGQNYYIVAAPAAQPPLFAKAGTIVPMQDVQQFVGEKEMDATDLHVFVDKAMNGQLVEDDGETDAYKRGEELRTTFTGNFDGQRLQLTISKGQGKYRPPRKVWRVLIRGLEKAPRAVTVNGQQTQFNWDAQGLHITVPADPAKPAVLEAKF